MAYSLTQRKRIRKSFGRHSSVALMPNLIDIQKKSYDAFLQKELTEAQRKSKGLEGVFKSVFPIEDAAGTATLEYVKYDFGKPKYNVTECIQRGLSYGAPLKVTVRLIVWEVNEEAGTREVMSIKEQEVYLVDLPLMTDNGTFIVNGTERVVVSQMHRSPGVFFDHDGGSTHSSGKVLFSARVIPYRGSWLDFEFDAKDLLYFRIDRRRKIYISSLLRALGMDNKEIVKTYFKSIDAAVSDHGWVIPYVAEDYIGEIEYDLIDAKSGDIVVEKGAKVTPRKAKKLKEDGLKEVILSDDIIAKRYTAEEIVNSKTGEIIVNAGVQLSSETLNKIRKAGNKKIKVVDIAAMSKPYILDSLTADKNQTREDSLFDIYRVMRPGEPPTIEAAETISAIYSSMVSVMIFLMLVV
jgi:DNA-directed RNA polymerase subunit beta